MVPPKVDQRQIAELTQEEDDILAQLMEDEDDAPGMDYSAAMREKMKSEIPPEDDD